MKTKVSRVMKTRRRKSLSKYLHGVTLGDSALHYLPEPKIDLTLRLRTCSKLPKYQQGTPSSITGLI
jgi:hypothetical protein